MPPDDIDRPSGEPIPRRSSADEVSGLSEAELEASFIHQRVLEAISDVVPETAKEEVAGKVISILTEQIETYSSIVPHPRHAEHWERILPGSADRILVMAEQRTTAALEQGRLEAKIQLDEIVRDDNEGRRLANFKMGGLITGFLLGLAMISGAVFLEINGHTALALALVGASALGTIGYFVNSNWHQDAETPSE